MTLVLSLANSLAVPSQQITMFFGIAIPDQRVHPLGKSLSSLGDRHGPQTCVATPRSQKLPFANAAQTSLSLLRSRGALDQIGNALRQVRIIHNVEQPASSILAALTVRPIERSLLVHIAENGIGMTRGGDTDLRMIPVLLCDSLQPDRLRSEERRVG